MKPRILITEHISGAGVDLLSSACECLIPWQDGRSTSGAEMRSVLYDVDAVLVRLFSVDAHDLAQTSRLKVIGKHGVGVDNIDCQAATRHGVAVVNTPVANSNAVAEHAITSMLVLARQLEHMSREMRAGRFDVRNDVRGVEVAGKSLGVVGLGRIGARVVEIAALGLGMAVYVYDPLVTDYAGPGTQVASVGELLPRVDFLSFHVPLTPETRDLINAESIAQLKPGCQIVNTARGGVVNEVDVATALEAGDLAGAAIDVFEDEPLPQDHPLLAAPNCLLTPHIAGITKESMDRMATHSAQGVLDVLEGRRPQHLVNPEVMTN
jgi:D-3-phosphoglycerate dehydrogenase